VMDILAMGIVIPVLPQLVRQFTHGDNAQAAHYIGDFGLIFGLMQFICAPIIGSLSDRFGRRPVLLASIFGLGVDYLLMANAPTLGWLFIGRTISGITAASFSTASAYIADVTPPEKRARSFGLIGAAFGVGFTLGPALGGLLGHYDLRLPFWAAAGLALINGIYGLFVLPESLPPERRAKFSLAKANPVGSFVLLKSHPELLGLASVLFLYYLAHQVLQSTLAIYTAERYHWGAQMLGFCLMGIGVSNIIMQGRVIGPFVTRFGERGALYTGLAAGAVGFLIYGMAATSLQFWSALPAFAFMSLTQPGYQALMSRRVSPSEQGRLQGANSGLMAIAGIVGPKLFTGVFAWSITASGVLLGKGASLYLAAALMVMALAVAVVVTRRGDGAAQA